MAAPTATAEQPTGVSFKSPEDTINAYMQGIAENNIQKILQTLAIDEMSEHFDFELYTERVGIFIPTTSLAPSEYPLYVESNKRQLSADMLHQMNFLAYSLLSSEPVGEGTAIQIDPERTRNFVEAVDPGRLSSLDIQRIDPANKLVMETTPYLESAAALARIFGADESTERVALLLFEENYYYAGFTLLRYGETWKISRQASAIADTNPMGAANRTTPGEYETMISGE